MVTKPDPFWLLVLDRPSLYLVVEVTPDGEARVIWRSSREDCLRVIKEKACENTSTKAV